jgi:protein-tyrosine phosphatase
MPSILFVCTANQFRSPLAAACLLDAIQRARLAGVWIVESAGTWTKAGIPAPELSRQIASELGLPGLESHLTRQVDQELLSQFDLIIAMEAGHKEALGIEFPSTQKRVFMLSEIVEGIQYDIPDPVAPGIDPNEVAHELKMLIDEGVSKITHLAESLSARS